MTPERIADYEIVQYLTAGGMADLYLARSPRQDSPVVLKTIQRKYVELTRVVKMFIDEGRIAKALDHPNIVRIFDVGQESGAYFIAMELIRGRDLLAIARRGIEAGRFLPLPLAVSIIAQVANGLIYAHEKRTADGEPLRVVHCDISPGNVVVSFGGTAKIVDFGIARATIQLRAEDQTVTGKYNYMAPEQIRGEPLDALTDLFSLGVILYELTVGRRLFRGPADEVKRRVLAGEIPRPRELKPDLPEALERILLRALAPDRDARYASARELREDLMRFLSADGRPAGKRELAEYLHAIFGPVASTGGADAAAFARMPGEEEEDELSLDSAVPGLMEVTVDAEDPEPERAASPQPTRNPLPSPPPTATPSSPISSPIASPIASSTSSPPTRSPMSSARSSASGYAGPKLLFAALTVLVVLGLYLFFRR